MIWYQVLNLIKKVIPIVTELYLRIRKFNVLLIFFSQSYFKLPKTIRLNSTHYFTINIPNKKGTKINSIKSFAYIDFKDSIKLCKNYTKEPCSFFVNDTTLSSDNPLQFRKNSL